MRRASAFLLLVAACGSTPPPPAITQSSPPAKEASTDAAAPHPCEGDDFVLERSTAGLPPGLVDTGFPTLVTIAPGELHGMTPDMSYIEGVAAGD